MQVSNSSSSCFAVLRDLDNEIPLDLCRGLNITGANTTRRGMVDDGKVLGINQEMYGHSATKIRTDFWLDLEIAMRICKMCRAQAVPACGSKVIL